MTDTQLAKAKKMYEMTCEALDDRNWTYDRHDDEFIIQTSVRGDDLPIECFLIINGERNVFQFVSVLPCKMPEDKRAEGAIATCVVNYGILNGCFEYDIKDGAIKFKLTANYRNIEFNKDYIAYLMDLSISTVDNYNDKFFMLAKGLMSIDKFIETVED